MWDRYERGHYSSRDRMWELLKAEAREDGQLQERTVNRKDGPVTVATPYGTSAGPRGESRACGFQTRPHSGARPGEDPIQHLYPAVHCPPRARWASVPLPRHSA